MHFTKTKIDRIDLAISINQDKFMNIEYLLYLPFSNILEGRVRYFEKPGHKAQLDRSGTFNCYITEFADNAFD